MRLKLRDTLLMWFVKLRLLVIVRPRYLNSDTHSISFPSNNISGRFVEGREVNNINLLFKAFGTSLFTLKYPVRSENNFFILANRPSIVLALKTKAASSANKMVISSTDNGRSLMYILKHSGPRIDPWGTPLTTGKVREFWPFR